jgi:hypothetical protein
VRKYTNGEITIAGTLVFTVFDKHVLYDALLAANPNCTGQYRQVPLVHQLPPFNITVSFTNEYGFQSVMAITGVQIVDEGQTMSIDDMITENVMSYVAQDVVPMRNAEDIAGIDQITFRRGLFTNEKIEDSIAGQQKDILQRIAELNKQLAVDVYEKDLTDPVEAKHMEEAIKIDIRDLQKQLLQLQDPTLNAIPVAFRIGDDVARAYMNRYRYDRQPATVKALTRSVAQSQSTTYPE